MNKTGHPRLALFFTRGVSLDTWDRIGLLERELALYLRLQQRGVRVSFLTYGNGTERRQHDLLNGIKVIPLGNSTRPRRNLAMLLMRHFPTLLQTDILKTNQILGSDVAIRCKRLFRKKLIVRCGYLPSVMLRQQGGDSLLFEQTMKLERDAFQAADAAVVASDGDRQYVLENHSVEPARVRVIPNYVVTDTFAPMPEVRREYDLVCVARAAAQKNIDGLLAALASLKSKGRDVSLLLLGAASTTPAVRSKVEANRLNVTLGGSIPNFELPKHLNSARVFVMPSHYEGTPKALLEAMSCGIACIGSDVIGIRELIKHDQTGWLCGTEPGSIESAIQHVLDDDRFRDRIGRNAQEFVLDKFDVDRVLELELELLHEVGG